MNQEENTTAPANGVSDSTFPAQEKARKTYTVYYDVYDHGFVNGILKIPREAFELFIFHLGNKDLSKKELGITLQEIETQRKELEETKKRRLELQNVISANVWELQANIEQKERIEFDIASTQHQIEDTENQADRIKPEYNWTNVSLFLLMGVIFIGSDWYVTYDVLLNGLKMQAFGAITLALAMSGITFVIKPTIDRLFEKPYLRGESSRKHWLLSCVSGIALLVLGLMGYYREEYLRTDLQMSFIEGQIRAKQVDITEIERKEKLLIRTGANTTPDGQALATDYQERKKALRNEVASSEKQLIDIGLNRGTNRALYWIFVLSNILFAVAAAICLSIAFPAADILIKKQRLKKAARQNHLILQQLKEEIANLSERSKAALIQRDQAGNALRLLPDIATLEQALEKLTLLSKTLLKKITEHDIGADVAFYNEAYERGKICELGDRIVIHPHQLGSLRRSPRPSGVRNNPETTKEPETGGESGTSPGYLHQQIRQIIEYNHQRNKYQLNGEDD
ncbi:MAG: hypothetical protein IT259_14070 [Saprospiraceae bacterium]|nr:hypothetical protein [Saprospiraceae bacterium]